MHYTYLYIDVSVCVLYYNCIFSYRPTPTEAGAGHLARNLTVPVCSPSSSFREVTGSKRRNEVGTVSTDSSAKRPAHGSKTNRFADLWCCSWLGSHSPVVRALAAQTSDLGLIPSDSCYFSFLIKTSLDSKKHLYLFIHTL